MTPHVETVRHALTQTTGLRFDDDKSALLADLLTTRVGRSVGFAEVSTYVERLSASSPELEELARELMVPETYFLRNRDQFRVLEDVLRRRPATPSRRFSVLSAGCSTGEEAYSAAISILEAQETATEASVSVLGVDLNAESLERARRNSYPRWSMRATPDDLREQYFHKVGKRFAVADAAHGLVRFEQANLLRPVWGLFRQGAFDAVYCRNVLMYLTPLAARRIVDAIARSLVPGGLLFLGHAENLRGLSQDFHLRHSHGTFYYQLRHPSDDRANASMMAPREEAVRATMPPPDGSWTESIANAASCIEKLSHRVGELDLPKATSPQFEAVGEAVPAVDLSPTLELVRQERFHEALRLLTEGPTTETIQPDAQVVHALLLASTGDLRAAEHLCRELLAADELNAEAHYVLAICVEQTGELAEAVEHHRAAVYLDPEFSMPHLHLGRIARRAGGRVAEARRELGLALGLLPTEDAANILLFGGGFHRDALIQVCRAELAACGDGS